jgi:hypothetical protein
MNKLYMLQQTENGSWWIYRRVWGLFWWPVTVRTPLSRAVEWLEENGCPPSG